MNQLQTTNDVVRSDVSLTDDNTTGEKSQVKVKRKNKTSYTLTFLLYPDNASHAKCLAEVIRRYDYAYILHDKDEFEEDFKEHCLDPNIPDDHLLIKKAHYHVLTFHPSRKASTQMAREMGLEMRFCQEVTDRNSMLCYLTHMGDRGKHQYSFDDVVCNRRSLYLEGLETRLTKTEKLEKMIAIIQNKKCVTVSFALKLLAREGLTDFALKHFSALKTIVEENYHETRFTPFGDLNKIKSLPLEELNEYEDLQEVFNIDN